jgi:periplasmic protein TonB
MTELWRKRLRWAGWGIFGLLLVWGLAELAIMLLSTSAVPVQPEVTTVTQVVVPPPPPPPVPPPPQKMIQAPKETMSAVKAPATKSTSVPKPPGNPLSSDLGPGKDSFGEASGSGGGDTIGGDGGGGGDPLGSFQNQLSDAFTMALTRDQRTRFAHYDTVVRVIVSATGKILHVQVDSTGSRDLDQTIAAVLSQLDTGAVLPAGMPQPVVIHLNSQ